MEKFIITKNDSGQRLDKFVLKVTTALPKSLLYKAIRTKKIKVNRKRCEAGDILSVGDEVLLFLPPDFFGRKEEAYLSLVPRLSVVYEDENLVICDKSEGMSCHSDEKQKTGTLIDHIKKYLVDKGEFCPSRENSFAPALCNRIDRNTTGLVICAKNAEALREMNALIKERKIEKRYLALIHGIPKEEHAVLTHYLLKDSEKNEVRVFDAPRKGALTAVTEFWLREVTPKGQEPCVCLVQILLHTGRTHQIRAQFSHIGHPLVGDGKYGTDKMCLGFSHQALRASSLKFHPDENSFFSYLAGTEISAPEDKRFFIKKKF